MKPEWQKQKAKGKKEEFRRTMTEEEIAIARIVEKKEDNDEGEDLIELRTVEKMVPRQFHKYL